MGQIVQDIRFALRTLTKARGFTAISIVTIALGIGAGSAVFSMVEGVLIRRLPYQSNERLVRIEQPSAANPDAGFSVPEVQDFRDQLHSFDLVAEYHSMAFQLYGLGEPQRVETGVVSDDFFTLLGVTPLLGRTFLPGEDAIGAPPVVVLSYEYWKEHFGSNPKVVGATFSMNDRMHTIVGVLPPLPVYPGANDMWMPAGACPFRSAPAMMSSRSGRMLQAFARLTAATPLSGAQVELRTVARRLHLTYPAAYPAVAKLGLTAVSLRDELTRSSRPLLFSLLAMAAFVLIIAGANFANLTLSRQVRRAREIALRAALGAHRGRIYRQLATESLLVTLVGGALGVAIAFSGLGLLRTLASHVTPRGGEIAINPVVLCAAIGVSTLIGLGAALVPLSHAGGSLADRLRASVTTTVDRRDGRLRDLLVGSQITVAFVLLVAAGLMVRSLLQLEKLDGGYRRANVLTARVSLNFSAYTSNPKAREFADKLLARIAGQPGVASVALASDFPMNNGTPSIQPFKIAGRATPAGLADPQSDATVVSEGYFTTIGVAIRQGRVFSAGDRDTINAPAVISERLARTYWPGGNAVGARLSIDGGKTWNPVVGVVADVRQNGLSQDVSDEIYLPAYALPPFDIRVLVRANGDPAVMAKVIRNAVYSIDPNQAIASVQTLDQLRGEQLTEPRVTATLLVAFAVLALAITAGGLGGVVATSVDQRVSEVGIRVALGATRSNVLWLVVRQAATVAVIGLGFGLVGSLITSRLFASLLFDTKPTDILTYAGVGFTLLSVTLVACIVPAGRALRIDPMEALRAH